MAVDSKNEMDNALAGLKHSNGVLKPDDFVDINPAEREIVSSQLPGVATPVMDGAENYIKVLDHSGYFEATT